MANLSKPHALHNNRSVMLEETNAIHKQLCLIVGLVCMAGFCVDMLTLVLPLAPFQLSWRMSVLEQVGDRSIVFLLGSALVIYSQLINRRVVRPLSLLCLGVGIAFMLSCLVVIRDSLVMQDVTISRISNQAEVLQARIREGENSPELPADISLDQLREAAQQVASEAEQLKQNSRTEINKLGLSSMGNLVVVGLGLMSVGRFGLATSRRIARGG